MSDRKKSGGSRGTVTWGADEISSPPTRRSQRNSASFNKSSDSPVDRSGADVMSDRKKSGGSRGTVTWGADEISSPPTRRSQRNSASFNKSSDSPIPSPVMKRSVTAKKIMPRKTLAALVSAESQPKAAPTVEQPSPCSSSAHSKTVLAASQSTPIVSSVAVAPRRSSRISPNAGKENTVLDKSHGTAKDVPNQSTTSKIDILSPIPLNIPQSPTSEDRQKVMSAKVRRSYSRLEMSMNGSSFLYSPTRKTEGSGTSTPNLSKSGRRSLFGFDKLLSSEEDVQDKKVSEKMKQTFNESSSRTSAKQSEEPDPNIPGVALAKQKRRKRKVQQIEVSALDEWAAAMNAEFDEAERFDLLVE